MPGSPDPTAVESIAVTATDLVSALETNRTTARTAVLRITPPFSARMRARLHIDRGEEYETTPRPLHVQPGELLDADAPALPRPGDTEDELRADPGAEYTVDRHRERHRNALEEWRSAVVEAVPDRVTVGTDAGPVTVDVAVLDDDPGG